MTITLNGTTGITTPDLTSTDDITANSSAVLTSASLPTALNATGSAPIYAARAWVNFNGTGTVAIRAAGNVSSITDNATGDYTVTFTNAMPDANYVVTALNTQQNRGSFNDEVDHIIGETYTASQFRIFCNNSNSGVDLAIVSLAFFR